MAYKQDNVTYYDLRFDPRTAEEALEALRKIQSAPHEAYKPDVASAALRYFSVFTNAMAWCHWYEYLTGEVRGKMEVLTGESSYKNMNHQGYINAFYSAINLMIYRGEEYLQHKEKFDKNIPILEILEAENNEK